MSEKRFSETEKHCYYTSLVFDNQTQEELGTPKVVDLLNDQQATIKKLQDLCGESDSENAKLRIENKKLQEEIKLLKPTNVEQYEQIIQLQEENEQLKIANAKWLDKSLQDKQIRYSNANCKELSKKYLQLKEENEQLRKIGVMYQTHNPCKTCTHSLENKVCCAEPVLICDDRKKNFIQGLCKKHKQFQKSIRCYDDD